MQAYSSQVWYIYLTKWQQELVDTAFLLLEREESKDTNLGFLNVSDAEKIDYSFLIFPMAKAYEGFLKKYLFDLQLIDESIYNSRRFRIGRALNPDVRSNQRDKHWLYDDITEMCGDHLAKQMWSTWLECRNRVFHFFPLEKGKMNVPAAHKKIDIIAKTMEAAVSCLQDQ